MSGTCLDSKRDATAREGDAGAVETTMGNIRRRCRNEYRGD